MKKERKKEGRKEGRKVGEKEGRKEDQMLQPRSLTMYSLIALTGTYWLSLKVNTQGEFSFKGQALEAYTLAKYYIIQVRRLALLNAEFRPTFSLAGNERKAPITHIAKFGPRLSVIDG